jgi:hypothetical protein
MRTLGEGEEMAITGAQLQAALGVTSGRDPRVVREYGVVGAYQEWLIVPGVVSAGRSRLVRTTAADNAATQAAAVLVALAA